MRISEHGAFGINARITIDELCGVPPGTFSKKPKKPAPAKSREKDLTNG